MKLKSVFIPLFALVLIQSCASKKDILYFQDSETYNANTLNYESHTLQPNDIVKITVGALVPELAIPYNKISNTSTQVQNNIEIMKLEGYLVNKDFEITFPVLGVINVQGKTVADLEKAIQSQLVQQGHLQQPSVIVRLINAKVTVLGEVANPGTISYTEDQITVLQALGYAGDLKIDGLRDDVIVMRETNGAREIAHLDLTSTNLLESPFYYLKPNDVIMVQQNYKKVKSAGFVGDTGTILGVASLILSVTILLTN